MPEDDPPIEWTIGRVVTLVAGALPMLLWLPLLALIGVLAFGFMSTGIFSGELSRFASGVALTLWCCGGLWGAGALWVAALGPTPVSRATSIGLACGILAMFLTIWIPGLIGEDSAPSFDGPFSIWLTLSPILVAAWQLLIHLRNR